MTSTKSSCEMPWGPNIVSELWQRFAKGVKIDTHIVASSDCHLARDVAVPSEFKVVYSNGKMRPSCSINVGYRRPTFLGEDIQTPSWWDSAAITQALDRIAMEKVSLKLPKCTNQVDGI